MTITDLKKGQKGIIKEFGADMPNIKLLEMGCLPGNEVELVRTAPLNDPLYLNINGTHLAIRKQIAAQIEVVPL